MTSPLDQAVTSRRIPHGSLLSLIGARYPPGLPPRPGLVPGRGGSVGGPRGRKSRADLPAHLRAAVLMAFVIRLLRATRVKHFAEVSCLPSLTGVGRCRDRLCHGVLVRRLAAFLSGLGDHPKIAEARAASGSASAFRVRGFANRRRLPPHRRRRRPGLTILRKPTSGAAISSGMRTRSLCGCAR